jgi:hypothetical protein
MYDFIKDLDDYFCEKYANYDKLCVISGYRMPKMQTSEVREDGRTYAYTLPPETMRLALQEEKSKILAQLKKQICDKTFSFSFRPLGLFARGRNKSSRFGLVKWMKIIFAKYNLSFEEAGQSLSIDPDIWKGIYKGNYLPTKNLLFSLALTAQLSMDDLTNLLAVSGYEWDFAIEKDVVISYLVGNKIFNRDMMNCALAEYKVTNLFIKEE